ncbi:MAG: hypothetical protein K5651_08605, partial [Bacteroidales bacterium]|nr:hypothetical protein [Bacteroidales bacterium]
PLYHYRKNNGASISHDRKALRDSISARNFLQLFAFWRNREDAPFQDVLPELYQRIGWTACRWNRSLLQEEPSIKGHVLALPMSRFTSLKSRIRLSLTKNWLRRCTVPSNRVLCCIFNHNENEKAISWSERLSPWFPTLILDSGSQPPCDHPSAVQLDNIFYSGLMNEAWRRAREGGYPWVMVLTSDLEISSHQLLRLVKRVERMSWTTNVGLYQPANAEKGSSHWHSRYVWPPRIRRRSFQEGWFHLVRTDLLDKICPIDLSVNKLGWGLDTALSYFSIMENKLILVDSGVTVRHPAGTGYNREEAERQMWEWYKTIPGFVDPSQLPVPRGIIVYGDE